MDLKTELVNSEHGFDDYDVKGHSSIKRACVPNDIKVGDMFNIYHGESSKSGVIWRGNLPASIKSSNLAT